MADIKNIIFDLGKVIINVETELAGPELERRGASNVKEMHDHLVKTGAYHKIETGELSPAGFRDEIRKFSGEHFTDEEIDETWNIMIKDLPPHREQLLKDLKDHYRVFLLSNTNAIHYDYYHDYFHRTFGYSLDDLFEKAYYSHRMGKRKPDPAIYKTVMEDSGLDPEETLFIDDKAENIEAARSVGIQGYLLGQDTDITELFDDAYRFTGFEKDPE